MNQQILLQIWVTKFCIRIAFPKINPNTFLVFLAIKLRLMLEKHPSKRFMDSYEVKPLPSYVLKGHLIEYQNNDNFPIINHKCLIISKKHYVELSAQNLFYMDNGILWLACKLAPAIKLKQSQLNEKKQNLSISKYNFNFITSEIHKKLWTEESAQNVDNNRILPVIGGTAVPENVIYTSETELYNLSTCYGLQDDNIHITFHPILSYDNAPKIATAAEVSLVVNEFDLSSNFLKDILNNFFEVPKVVSLNDLFCIDLTPEITLKHHYKYLDLVESAKKLYFKCTKLEKDSETEKNNTNIVPTFYIVRGVTTLTLGESIHVARPREKYYEYEQKNVSDLLHLCPTGLKEKFLQIQETIAPFLNGDLSELSTTMSKPIIPMLLLTGSLGSGRHMLVKTLAKYNGLNCLKFDCNILQSTTAKQTESKINLTIQKSKAAAPAIVLLENFEVFAVDPENNEDARIMEYFTNTITELYQNYTKQSIIFIAITERQELKPNILRIFLEKFHIPTLNVQQRYEMLEWYASVMQLKITDDELVNEDLNKDEVGDIADKATKDALQRIAAKTRTFVYGDLDTLIHFAMRESYLKQLSNEGLSNLQLVKEEHFNSALESIRNLQSQHLDAPKIPKVHWEDIGGLSKLKKELLKTIEFPIKYPHLFKNSSLKRSGILLYGPPGCGKTLVAKAVSTELNVSFLSVKGPELLNMYIGQSEENVRKVFSCARASSPCIVFLDEVDAAAARRGAAGDSGGAADRVVAQLLAELDGVNDTEADSSSFVFVMGATNRPDLLEQSLLRPGRLDKLIYVGPYCGMDEKVSVLTALCRSYNIASSVRLPAVASRLPRRVTGAELLQVVTVARAAAVRNVVAMLQAGSIKESELSLDSVIIGEQEFNEGVEAFRPSVTDEELAYYESLQM